MEQNLTAIIYDKKGRVISKGYNSYTRSHPLQKRFSKSENKIYIHAEIDSITKCKDKSKMHEIYVYRLNKQGKLLNAKPCEICQKAIIAYGFKVVRWST